MKALQLTAFALLGSLLLGCEEPPAKVPPQPQPTGTMPYGTAPYPTAPGVAPPGQGAPPVPAGAMNPQASAVYQQGVQAFNAGQLQQALTLFTQATQADGNAYPAFYSLGTVQERLNQLSAAAASYQRAYTIKVDYTPAMVAYALVLAKQGSLSEADAFLTERRGKFPKSAPILTGLAEVKSLEKDTASAQDIAQEALKYDPAYAPAMMVLARDHYRNRRLDLSLYALRAILDGFDADNPARDKTNPEGHLLRAFIWAEQGHRNLAIEAFRKVVELRPDVVVARLRLATYLLESNGAAEAKPILQTALQYDSENLGAHLSLGDAYRLLEEYPQAEQEFKWVLARDASLPQVHYNLGLLYLFAPAVPGMSEKQQVEAALVSLNKFKELRRKSDPDDHDELINRAVLKKAEIEALEQANNPPPPPPPEPAPAGG